MLRKLGVTVIAALVLLPACDFISFEDPDCPVEDSNKYMIAHEMAMDEYLDAERDVGRANDLEDWTNAIARMEASRDLFESMVPPPCLQEVHDSMLDGMSAEINAFRAAFNGDLDLAEEWMDIAERAFQQHDNAIERYNARAR
jgi:hypothetical protein